MKHIYQTHFRVFKTHLTKVLTKQFLFIKGSFNLMFFLHFSCINYCCQKKMYHNNCKYTEARAREQEENHPDNEHSAVGASVLVKQTPSLDMSHC